MTQERPLKGGEKSMGKVCTALAVIAVLTMILATGMGPVTVAPLTTAKILISRIPLVGNLIDHSWQQLD